MIIILLIWFLIAKQNTASLPEGSDILTAVIITLFLASK